MSLKKKTPLLQYYLSYISVALIGCAAIGMIIFFLSVTELRSFAQQSECTHLQSAAQDLDAQVKVLENIRDGVNSTLIYRQDYLTQDRYRQVELLNDLAQYVTHSVICNEYFLFYQGTDSVYSQEAKCTFARYCIYSSRISADDSAAEQLQEALNQISEFTMIPVANGQLLMVYPCRLGASGSGHVTAVLCFVIAPSAWLNRVAASSSNLSGALSIYYQGQLLDGEANPGAEALSFTNGIYTDDQMLAVISPTGNFTIAEEIPSGGWYSGLRKFRIIILVILSVSVVVVLLMTYLIARKNHDPIRQLAAQVRELLPHDDNDGEASELKQIESALLQTHQQNSLNQRQLEQQTVLMAEQAATLRQQVLLLVLNGNLSDSVFLQLKNLSLSLDGSYFCVYSVRFKEEAPQNVLISIQMLSDEDQKLYTCRVNETLYAVIGSFAVASTADELTELIQEVCIAMNCNARVQKGMVVDALEKMPASYYTAQFDAASQKSAVPVADAPCDADSNDQAFCQQKTQLLHDLRTNNRVAGMEHLRQLLKNIRQNYPSLMLQRSMIADLLSELIHLLRELGIPIPPEESGAILVYQHSDAVCRDLSQLVDRLFERLTERQTRIADDRALQIRQYIDEHALDYEISLQKLSEVFQISTKQINNDIRSVTGVTYKEYELRIRIRRARELLAHPDYSVVQVGEMVGYVDVSSFIKAFKNVTGTTPAMFRRTTLDADEALQTD